MQFLSCLNLIWDVEFIYINAHFLYILFIHEKERERELFPMVIHDQIFVQDYIENKKKRTRPDYNMIDIKS